MKIVASKLAIACAAALGAGTALAQAPAASFPSKPLRIIVPYPPGGTSDILSRMIGVKITENWGQSVIVENRTGANGNIGAESVARAPADGYTYLLTDIGNLSIARTSTSARSTSCASSRRSPRCRTRHTCSLRTRACR